ncbi:1-acyl-sn-glycerol-3-phosphate acyltransferase [Caulobacter sp. 17J80-11]|uniref:lysophospholipid acyltransferase family protein n=1 Tax=Caulobacter sp. 17J80-11 TaxID=2763502 RepID=UPI001653E49C|nr:lysophospholipid acyltransferase family protein [Caulobacter sp. 17J80-11]MBC6980153.1 1-acyl-sn-glycerol-3-phosphate acyltransferase [Caulobacter sp. 17J80-11]
MLVVRSLLFMAYLYLSMVFMGVVMSPFLLAPRPVAMRLVQGWARSVLGAARILCGIKVEVRGLEHRPSGAALIAAKHQGMLDVIAPFTFLDDPCFVMKQELLNLPFFGWYAKKLRMVPVDRSAQAAALRKMVNDTNERLQDVRQVVIFPEGTRTEPGAEPDYKPGVAALYRDLNYPCELVATNSGLCWPAHGFIRKPGTVVFEFLEPLPAGLKRGQFMSEMQTRIEAASTKLLTEA